MTNQYFKCKRCFYTWI